MAHILLIEDDATLSDMYILMLELKGHQVFAARNGKAGLAEALAHPPQVILLDMMMPEMNGMETLRELKTNPASTKIPVAMLSNLADEQQATLALEAGAVSYVIKSNCNADSLNDLVSAMLQSR